MNHIISTCIKHFRTLDPLRVVFETATDIKALEAGLQKALNQFDFNGYDSKTGVDATNTFKGDVFELYSQTVLNAAGVGFAKFTLTDVELADRAQMGYDFTAINADGLRSYVQAKFVSNYAKEITLDSTPNLINFPFAVSNDADESIFELAVSDPITFQYVLDKWRKRTLAPRSFIVTNSIKVSAGFCKKHNIVAITRNDLAAIHANNALLIRKKLLSLL